MMILCGCISSIEDVSCSLGVMHRLSYTGSFSFLGRYDLVPLKSISI